MGAHQWRRVRKWSRIFDPVRIFTLIQSKIESHRSLSRPWDAAAATSKGRPALLCIGNGVGGWTPWPEILQEVSWEDGSCWHWALTKSGVRSYSKPSRTAWWIRCEVDPQRQVKVLEQHCCHWRRWVRCQGGGQKRSRPTAWLTAVAAAFPDGKLSFALYR